MGRINIHERLYNNIEKLSDKECPNCSGSIELLDSSHFPQRDSFDYKCSICNKYGGIISITGRALGNFIKTDEETRDSLIRKIRKCPAGSEVIIDLEDFKLIQQII